MLRIATILISLLISGACLCQSFVEYDENGVKVFEGDSLNGSITAWYPSGQIMRTGFLKDGRLDSLWIEYSTTGKILKEVEYIDGQRSTTRTYRYYENGQLAEDLLISVIRMPTEKSEGEVKRDWYLYYSGGEPLAELHFVNGEEASFNFWHQDGSEMSRNEYERLLKGE